MKRSALRLPFLCTLFAALLLSAGNARAHGVDPLGGSDAGHDAVSVQNHPAPQGEVTVDMDALEDAIAHAVERALAQQRAAGPELRDIIGGLGWIIGLLGLAAYMKHRRC